MPVTFKVAPHDSEPVARPKSSEHSAETLLDSTWRKHTKPRVKCTELLQSTFGRPGAIVQDTILPSRNGFVDTVTAAYNKHHHLTLRPDDVWIAILSQLSLYVNAHSEELRSHFVAHEGQNELVVHRSGNMYSTDFGSVAIEFTGLLHRNVVDPELKDWILPDFSTTTENDTITASVIMMATLKAYFTYTCSFLCGIPSVTLEGEKKDWESLLARIDKLPSFGTEPSEWAKYLRPILRRFAATFDGEPDVDFWRKICHYRSEGSGSTYLCGWIAAFCAWDAKGKWLGGRNALGFGIETPVILDGVQYPVVDTGDIPAGFAEVDVKLVDGDQDVHCLMVGGHVACEVIGDKVDGVRPRPGWFLFVKEDMTEEELKR